MEIDMNVKTMQCFCPSLIDNILKAIHIQMLDLTSFCRFYLLAPVLDLNSTEIVLVKKKKKKKLVLIFDKTLSQSKLNLNNKSGFEPKLDLTIW